VSDPQFVKELYTRDLKAWFGDLGDGTHTGEPDDPRMGVICVKPNSILYSLQDVSALNKAYQIAKGAITGEIPECQSLHEISKSDICHATDKTSSVSIGCKR